MALTLIDGRFVAQQILERVKKDVVRLKKQKIHPSLTIILAGDNPSGLAYIRQKRKACEFVGINHELLQLSEKISTKALIGKIETLNKSRLCGGILVQMPLPKHIEVPKIIKAIDPYKDVDGFHAYNVGKMCIASAFEDLVPCTPRGVIRLLEHYKIPIEGKEAVVVGRSNIVGKPLALMLLNRGATVTVCHSKTKNLARHTKRADILCVAVGKPGFLKANMVKKGCTAIDVGFTRVGEKILGDIDFDGAKKKARFLTPVPGGVGPMTVACLMENVVRASQKQAKR